MVSVQLPCWSCAVFPFWKQGERFRSSSRWSAVKCSVCLMRTSFLSKLPVGTFPQSTRLTEQGELRSSSSRNVSFWSMTGSKMKTPEFLYPTTLDTKNRRVRSFQSITLLKYILPFSHWTKNCFASRKSKTISKSVRFHGATPYTLLEIKLDSSRSKRVSYPMREQKIYFGRINCWKEGTPPFLYQMRSDTRRWSLRFCGSHASGR